MKITAIIPLILPRIISVIVSVRELFCADKPKSISPENSHISQSPAAAIVKNKEKSVESRELCVENDGLGNNAKNIGILAGMKNIYLVPFGQDDCMQKENSVVADMEQIIPTAELTMEGKQLQPVLIAYK